MAGQHLGLPRDGQLCQLAQARVHGVAAAALQVGAADAAGKQGVAAEKILSAQQHHAAGGVARRMPCRKLQLIHCHDLAFRIAVVGLGKRVHLIPGQIVRFAVEHGVVLPAQGLGAAHMVKVAVGAQQSGEHGVVLLQNLLVVLHVRRRVNDDRMAGVRDQQKGIGVVRRGCRDVKCLHGITPSFSTRRCR